MRLTLNITAGNDKRVVLWLLNGLHDDGREPFPVELSEDVAVKMVSEVGTRHAVSFVVGDEGRVLLDLKGSDYKIGLWGIEVVGRLNGAKWRAYGDSMIHYTPTTERGAELVTDFGDADELTLVVGYATDIVPRKTSELVNDGADGEHPFVSEDELAAVATSGSYNDLKGTPSLNFIPTAQKGAANGVAELNGDGKIPTAQAQFALRGNLAAADIDSTALQTGFYRVIGQRLGVDILGGDEANGVLIQYSDGYKEQVLHVGRTAGAAAGEQVETYTRRYLPTPKRWTEWYKATGGGGGTSDDIYVVHIRPNGSTFTLVEPVQEVFAARGAGKTLIGIVEGVRSGGVLNYLSGSDGLDTIPLACAYYVNAERMTYDVYSIYDGNGRIEKNRITFDFGKMTDDEAKAGTAQVARTISASVLKQAILYHTGDLVNGGAYNSTTKKIELKHGSTVVAEIDAAPFIVDGMVDDVRIENGNLVIDFNTESGKQDIAIPLTEIFNPNNYYTKQQTDGLLSGKASTADVTALQQQVAGKQDTIQDLAEIRAGAALGATAIQEHQDISGKVDKVEGKGLSTNDYTNEEKTKLAGLENYDDTAVRELIATETTRAQGVEQQLNTDINAQTGRINTAINNLETAKTAKIAEMDAAKVAAETATAAAIVATQNADAATQATQTAIAQAERLNVELEGSVITVTDKDGNESEIDLLDATNERVYINVTTDVAGVSVEGLTINAYYNNAEQPSATATTDAQGKCYLDVPNNYRYRLVFPTIAGCDPITDVTHIAHASERIIDVEYKEPVPQPEVGEHLTLIVQKVIATVTSKIVGAEVQITYDGNTRTYTSDANGEVNVVIPYGKTYTITMPVLTDLYLHSGKYVYQFTAESAKHTETIVYHDYQSGIFIITADGSEYTLTQFQTARTAGTVQNEDAKLVKIFTEQLANVIDPVTGARKSGVFGLDIDLIRNTDLDVAAWKKAWVSPLVVFSSVPINGQSIDKPYYFDGLTASTLISTEAIEKNATVSAIDFALSKSMEIGDGAGGTITCEGFLGSVGQWQQLQMVIEEVDEILADVRPNGQYSLSRYSSIIKQTSTQGSTVGKTPCIGWNSGVVLTTYYNAYITIPFYAL